MVAITLARTITAAIEAPSWSRVLRLLTFAKFVLSAPAHGGKGAQRFLYRRVLERATAFNATPSPEIWEELQGEENARRSKRARRKGRALFTGPESEDPDLAVLGDEDTLRQVRQLVEDGAYAKAVKRLSSQGLHDPNDDRVLRAMKDLHPTGIPSVTPTDLVCLDSYLKRSHVLRRTTGLGHYGRAWKVSPQTRVQGPLACDRNT